ncbi:spirocyclase AveC family protein [Mycobacterium alsense]|uniref:spirocyclase AveC family protein n=1 Tax=Mycobacterium alsense TaxID=324058 RepID=UPI0009F48975|nr:spirocyclase AveC family protein [Mycobacterium alsense]
MLLAAQGPVPPATLHPGGIWFFNWVIPIVGGLVIVLAIADVVRRRRFTWGFLFLVSSMSIYWGETMGDWGQMLYYSPAFARHHMLEWLPLKTPNDPLFMPFAYAIYWSVHAVLVLWLSQWIGKRLGWSLLKAMLVLAVPVNYVWDFTVEGTASALGWWTYDPGIGPVLQWGSGGRITLLWTIGIMCVWPNLIAYWAGKPPIRGLNHLERFLRLDRFTSPKPVAGEPEVSSTRPGTTATAVAVAEAPARRTKQQEFDDYLNYRVTIPRWRFELMRLGAWVLCFQVSSIALMGIPLLLVRTLTGAESPYIP